MDMYIIICYIHSFVVVGGGYLNQNNKRAVITKQYETKKKWDQKLADIVSKTLVSTCLPTIWQRYEWVNVIITIPRILYYI